MARHVRARRCTARCSPPSSACRTSRCQPCSKSKLAPHPRQRARQAAYQTSEASPCPSSQPHGHPHPLLHSLRGIGHDASLTDAEQSSLRDALLQGAALPPGALLRLLLRATAIAKDGLLLLEVRTHRTRTRTFTRTRTLTLESPHEICARPPPHAGACSFDAAAVAAAPHLASAGAPDRRVGQSLLEAYAEACQGVGHGRPRVQSALRTAVRCMPDALARALLRVHASRPPDPHRSAARHHAASNACMPPNPPTIAPVSPYASPLHPWNQLRLSRHRRAHREGVWLGTPRLLVRARRAHLARRRASDPLRGRARRDSVRRITLVRRVHASPPSLYA